MGVIHKRPDTRRNHPHGKRLACLHRRRTLLIPTTPPRHPVVVALQLNPVPVNGRRLLHLIHYRNFGLLALGHHQNRPRQARTHLRLRIGARRVLVSQPKFIEPTVALPGPDAEFQPPRRFPAILRIDHGLARHRQPHNHAAHAAVIGIHRVHMVVVMIRARRRQIRRLQRHRQAHMRNPVAVVQPSAWLLRDPRHIKGLHHLHIVGKLHRL